jgi:quinolinate synthase
MVQRARSSRAGRFVVATETGILHRLSKEAPDRRFEALSEKAICRYMKMITLEKLRDSLRDMRRVVTVDPEVAAAARGAIQRMVEIV